jgi:murein DD-endopeptidase MepM/ murein hydrolase activator NlpD
MAIKIPPLPKTLTPTDLKWLKDSYVRLSGTVSQTPTPEYQETTTSFFEYLKTLTGQSTSQNAYIVLTAWLGQTAETTTTVPTAKLEILEKEAEERQKATAKIREQVQAFIKQNQERLVRAQKIQETLKDKVVYAKVEKPEPPKLTEKEQQAVATLKEAVKANPQQLTVDLAAEIKTRTKIDDLLAKQAALEVVQNLADPTIIDKTAILDRLAATPKATSPEVAEIATAVAVLQAARYQTSREIISSAFGENLASHLLGPEDLSQIKVTFSGRPITGGQTFALEQIPQKYSESLERENTFVSGLKDFSQQEIKSQFLSRAGGWLEGQIAKLPSDSALAKLYSSSKIQATLSFIGIGKPIAWIGTTGFGKLAVSTGFGPAFGWLGKVTGINFGVGIGKAAVTKVGAGLLAKTGLSATFAQIGAALGSWAPIVGTILGAIAGWLVGKIIDPILRWIQKHKEDLTIAGILGLASGVIFGSLPLVVLGSLFAVPGILSGIGIGGIGAGIAGFFARLGGAFVVTIGTPIIITLVVFPVVVALILFIINSGAYLVPPQVSQIPGGATIVSPYIDVTKTPVPPGPFQNNQLPLTIEYKVEIVAKKGPLQNVIIASGCNVIKKGASVACPKTDPAIPSKTDTISPTQSFSFSYKQTYHAPSYIDSLIVDTITVTADTAGQKGEKAAASAGVKIGNPPDTCPSIWPVDGSWTLTQTPGGGFSHSSIEAIDLNTSTGTVVKATHSGIARIVYTSGAYRPVYVDIVSNCGGKTIASRYAHLSAVSIKDGAAVTLGQPLGASGSDGTGPHLHYEFRGLKMEPPYIPKTIRRGCSSSNCGTIP